MKKTKIVATLGPSSSSLEMIEEMIVKGVDVFQINMSHTKLDVCMELIGKIRRSEKKLNKIIGIMLGTEGPSIRLDKLKEEEVSLSLEKEIRFYNYHVVCNNTQLSTNYDNLTNLVELHDEIILADGKCVLEVIDINDDNFLCEVKKEGIIKSNQTVHIKNGSSKLPFISKTDYDNIMFAINNNVDFLALSFTPLNPLKS